MCALWFLGGHGNAFDGSEKFAMGESTFARHVVEACRVIVQEFFAEAVKLPYGDELADCLRAAEQHDPPLPGAALFVDGTHIPYTPPAAIFMDYMNYKKFTSIQAQVVCDYREKVRDLVVGWSGKNNDGMVSTTTCSSPRVILY